MQQNVDSRTVCIVDDCGKSILTFFLPPVPDISSTALDRFEDHR